MKLIWRIILRVALLMFVVMPLWGLFFYKAMINEVNDETDDNLELYAEQLVRDYLTNRVENCDDNGTNNTYTIEPLNGYEGEDYCSYSDELIFVEAKNETEPARVLRMTFNDVSGDRFLVTVMTPTIETEDLIKAILNWITVLFCVLLVIILLIMWFVVVRSLRPLSRLLNWIENYKLGENIAPLDNYTDIIEFQKLNTSIVTFSERNEQLFEQQKQFIGNASHEIQTPIAICQNRLELLCNTDLSEEQLSEVLKTRKTLDYISRLNKSLLLLTKIDNGQFIEQSQINLTEITQKCIVDYCEIYSYKNLELSVSINSVLVTTMNRTLATILISNLIRNAFIHNFENGKIEIEIDDKRLIVRNSGDSTPLDKTHIFKRFWKSSNKSEGSTGLGLAITQAISRYYNFNIEYSFTNNLHIFIIVVQ